ncbi:SCP2 sterol-binding domain-containing protein [Virgibacillus doumboii]|uniref:SCP2 sterol-binding domain-containing protein n=1 Tax=Virgibacillus doumboii TaxID=2697503 RepID=UPI0013DF4416|nr:SCP2 sterol-binding domain-containing protein [Virgibacillus doumboii]
MANLRETFQEIDSAVSDDPSKAQGTEAVYLFNLDGDESGTYHIVFNGDKSYAAEGEADNADCTLFMDSNDFMKMVDGELNGTQAFMSGRLKIKGNMGLAIKLQSILASYNKARK